MCNDPSLCGDSDIMFMPTPQQITLHEHILASLIWELTERKKYTLETVN